MLVASDAALERRKQYLETLQKILPPTTSNELTGRISAFDKSWEDAIRRTGELPPDFNAMPSIAGLPDPLLLREGARTLPITTVEQWKRQRQWMRGEFEQTMNSVDRFLAASEEHIPFLLRKAERVDDYLQQK